MYVKSILIILLCILTVGVIRIVWSKMERRFLEQPLQLAFYGTPKKRYRNLDTKRFPFVCEVTTTRVYPIINHIRKAPTNGNKTKLLARLRIGCV
jgi:hypothetical protein